MKKSGSNALLTCPHCGVVPINWPVHIKWCRFVVETKSTHTLLVDTDGAVRHPMDRASRELKTGEEPKERHVPTTSKTARADTIQSAAERSWREQELERRLGNANPAQAVPENFGTGVCLRYQTYATNPEIRCAKCNATRTQLATHGDPGPCCSPFLTCSYDELWRSLPHGEDR